MCSGSSVAPDLGNCWHGHPFALVRDSSTICFSLNGQSACEIEQAKFRLAISTRVLPPPVPRRDQSEWSLPAADVFAALLTFLDPLDNAGLFYTLQRIRQESVLVEVAVPGSRWEVVFMRDGYVEVERFSSTGEIGDATLLEVLPASDREQRRGLGAPLQESEDDPHYFLWFLNRKKV